MFAVYFIVIQATWGNPLVSLDFKCDVAHAMAESNIDLHLSVNNNLEDLDLCF